jgi:hypothetical protein
VRLAYWSREGEPQAVMAVSGRVPNGLVLR